MRVCQFRHDGNTGLQCSGGSKAAESGRSTSSFYSHDGDCQTTAGAAALAHHLRLITSASVDSHALAGKSLSFRHREA